MLNKIIRSEIRYLTHPKVEIDPAIPVPNWTLSGIGRKRVEALANAKKLHRTTQIISSGERKERETAEIISAAFWRRRRGA